MRSLLVAAALVLGGALPLASADDGSAECEARNFTNQGWISLIALQCSKSVQLEYRFTIEFVDGGGYTSHSNAPMTPDGRVSVYVFPGGRPATCTLEVTEWFANDKVWHAVDISVLNIPNCEAPAPTNSPPSIEAGDELHRLPNSRVFLTASYQDPDADDTHTATIDWGDGAGAQPALASGGFITAETSFKSGEYDATVCVTDAMGETACDSTRITIGGAHGKLSPDMMPGEGKAKGLEA